MKCHVHYDRDAVSCCLDCGKGLCPECTSMWSIPICNFCNYSRASNDKKQVTMNLLFMLPLFWIGYSIAPDPGSLLLRLYFAYCVASIPWGWGILNRFTPNVFMVVPMFGYILYYTLKLGVSVSIGQVVLPYKVFVFIRNYQRAGNIQKKIKGI